MHRRSSLLYHVRDAINRSRRWSGGWWRGRREVNLISLFLYFLIFLEDHTRYCMDGSKGKKYLVGDITCRVVYIFLADFAFRWGGRVGGGCYL